jgi:hypothetical protein
VVGATVALFVMGSVTGLRMAFPFLLCWELQNGCGNFLDTFFTSIEMINCFLGFCLQIGWISLINFEMLNPPCLCGVHSTLSWYTTFFLNYGFDFIGICFSHVWCHTLVIPATWLAEIRRNVVEGQQNRSHSISTNKLGIVDSGL